MVKDIKNSNRFLSSMIHYTCLTLAVHKTMPRLHVVESILTCLGNTPFPHNLKIHGLRLLQLFTPPTHSHPPPLILFLCHISGQKLSPHAALNSISLLHHTMSNGPCSFPRCTKLAICADSSQVSMPSP